MFPGTDLASHWVAEQFHVMQQILGERRLEIAAEQRNCFDKSRQQSIIASVVRDPQCVAQASAAVRSAHIGDAAQCVILAELAVSLGVGSERLDP